MTEQSSDSVSTDKKRKPILTPEFIAEQRRLREERKRARRDEKERLGVKDQSEFDRSFIQRPMLKLPTKKYDNGQEIVIMSYNVLAQCLIRRKLFPENGKAILRWKNRWHVLIAELEHYSPDVLCLQEVDNNKVDDFWVPELKERLGMTAIFTTYEGKVHGQIIAYKDTLFDLKDEKFISFDEEVTQGAEKQINSRNTGMLVSLKLRSSQNTKGIIVGTAHMFWHPMGSYERTRQMAIFTREAVKFGENYKWPVILGGDFNSECFDTPYLCATTKPAKLDDDALSILRSSAMHVFNQATAEDQEEEDQSEDTVLLPQDVAQAKINGLIDNFDSVKWVAKSLYEYYRLVHPENVHVKGRGEPNFSNWAHVWRGLLDYIFVMRPLEMVSNDDEVVKGLKLLELLRLPEPHEMGPEPSGQPREGQFPSDHLCIMAKIQVD